MLQETLYERLVTRGLPFQNQQHREFSDLIQLDVNVSGNRFPKNVTFLLIGQAT
jgi:hypothetical protein